MTTAVGSSVTSACSVPTGVRLSGGRCLVSGDGSFVAEAVSGVAVERAAQRQELCQRRVRKYWRLRHMSSSLRLAAKSRQSLVALPHNTGEVHFVQRRHFALIFEEFSGAICAIGFEEFLALCDLFLRRMQRHSVGDDIPAFLIVEAGERRHEAVDVAARDDRVTTEPAKLRAQFQASQMRGTVTPS